MGLMDILKGKFVDPTYPGVHGDGNVITTRLDAVVKWGRKSSIWPMPFGTACCAIEFMALSASHYDLARFGAEVLRFSPRQADLMFVAGTIPDKLAPVLKTIYDQMPEPKWVISMGVCASSGGMFNNYAIVQGVDQVRGVHARAQHSPPPAGVGQRPDQQVGGLGPPQVPLPGLGRVGQTARAPALGLELGAHRRHLDELPAVGASLPGFEEEAALPAGGAHDPERAVGSGQHG